MSHSFHVLMNMDTCVKNYHHQPVNQNHYQHQPTPIMDENKNNKKIKSQTKKTSSCKAETNALQDDE
ncbi:hypothetical protein JFB93_04320 [Providencia rettgeri]|uniref:hypothetical protein n=1 Tax=Providencia TaxID=586 RepID=UPI000C7ED4DC|nr:MULTISPECIES: hypothetical protein [Providencia]AXH62542.1 hypothetical protein CYG50_11240 [Providencia huaxiensis]QQE94093.1 hypothetical protein JFB93_04320 [Providencia rettgeri]QWJ92558.1 hypothetical protein KM147_04365 [Providencia rettgeri]